MLKIKKEVTNRTYFRLQVAQALFGDAILTGSSSLMLLGFIERENIGDLDIILPYYRELQGKLIMRGPMNEYGNTFHGKLTIDHSNPQFKENYEWLCALADLLHRDVKFGVFDFWPAVDVFINPAEPFKVYQVELSTKIRMEMLTSTFYIKLADARNTVNAKLQYLLRFDKDHHYQDCITVLDRLYGPNKGQFIENLKSDTNEKVNVD
jgi:hypothetical protein